MFCVVFAQFFLKSKFLHSIWSNLLDLFIKTWTNWALSNRVFQSGDLKQNPKDTIMNQCSIWVFLISLKSLFNGNFAPARALLGYHGDLTKSPWCKMPEGDCSAFSCVPAINELFCFFWCVPYERDSSHWRLTYSLLITFAVSKFQRDKVAEEYIFQLFITKRRWQQCHLQAVSCPNESKIRQGKLTVEDDRGSIEGKAHKGEEVEEGTGNNRLSLNSDAWTSRSVVSAPLTGLWLILNLRGNDPAGSPEAMWKPERRKHQPVAGLGAPVGRVPVHTAFL